MRLLRTVESESPVAVLRDVISEAEQRGVRLYKLTDALRCGRIFPSYDRRKMSITAIAHITEALGGHLYAEWDD